MNNLTTNSSGGVAFKLSSEEAVAKLVCANIVDHKHQLMSENEMLASLKSEIVHCSDEFLAKLAIYTKKEAKMKDTSALLLAHLASRKSKYGPFVFTEIVTDISMLKKFVNSIRKGMTNRRSFGSVYRKLIRDWLSNKSDLQLFRESIGNDPSMGDIIAMVHPKPLNLQRAALYAYFLGKDLTEDQKSHLPDEIKDYESFLSDPQKYCSGEGKLPKTNIMKILNQNLSPQQWETLAKSMTFNQVVKNLNVLSRNAALFSTEVQDHICKVLSSKEEALRSSQMPYSLLMAYKAFEQSNYQDCYSKNKYANILSALDTALQNCTENIPSFEGKVAICLDVSGSMSNRIAAKGIATYLDAACVLALSFLKKNHSSIILPFDTAVHPNHGLSSEKTFMENYNIVQKFSGGGTDCSSAIRHLTKEKANVDIIIMISDNQSWAQLDKDSCHNYYTGTLSCLKEYKKINPSVKFVNIDISPSSNTQAHSDESVMLVSGFNDSVFKLLTSFLPKSADKNYWVNHINNYVSLDNDII
jgi:60 kDa SS-A/Ro ribonucleoprotein